MRWPPGILVWFLIALLNPPPARASEQAVRLLAVAPVVKVEQLVCRVRTLGLPAAKQLQSMRSGLISSVELHLNLLAQDDRPVVRQSYSLRLGFDLWEEIFSVTGAGRSRRFQSLAELQAYLSDMNDLPLGPAALLEPGKKYRLRVRLIWHPIAPEEEDRVADVIVGETKQPRQESSMGQDQQEASISLGRLIRFFYRSGGSGDQVLEIFSTVFSREDLVDGTH